MKKLGIAGWLAIFFAAITVVLVVVVSIFNLTMWNNRIKYSINETMEAVAESNLQKLELLEGRLELLYDKLSSSDSLASKKRNNYVDFFLAEADDLISDFSTYQEMNSSYAADVENALESIATSYSVSFLVSPNMPLTKQRFLPSINRPSLLFQMGNSHNIVNSRWLAQEEWYVKAKETDGEPYWFIQSGVVCMARQISVLSLDQNDRVKSYDMGVMLLVMDISWFSDNLISEKLTPNTRVEVTSFDGTFLWSNMDGVPDKALEMHHASTGGMRMTTWIPWSDIYEMTSNPIVASVMMLIFCVCLGAVLVLLASVYVSRPITRLSASMLHREGELIPDRLMPVRQDEIGVLYQNYNKQIITIRQQEEEKKQASIARLQAQINPHFLYNTLDSLCYVALLENSPKIADSLAVLARIFRYNTKDADGEVRLREELDILALYVSLYRERSAEELHYQPDCPNDLLDGVLIPKMIIQPLLENALQYGVVDGRCLIEVCCALHDGQTRIRVIDGGGRADTDLLNRYLAGECEIPHHSTGLGIRNVHQRIAMRYGEKYGLRYFTAESGKTVAEIRLPVMRTGGTQSAGDGAPE